MNPSQIIKLLDLTSLNDNDNEAHIAALCQKANDAGVAAVCVYPQFIKLAKSLTNIHVATVCNFPSGEHFSEQEINDALAKGADEIDLVMPYRAFLNGDTASPRQAIETARKACGDKCLKVILETGELATPDAIFNASKLAINAGADFIKTSTGKVSVGATLEAAKQMLQAIKGSHCGLKISGGVRTLEQAQHYIALVSNTMGKGWINPTHFRMGASSLLDALTDDSHDY